MKKIFLSAALLTSSFFYAQVRVGIESNNQYYLDDNEIKIEGQEAEERFRSNTYIKLDYFKNKWEFGTQIESYYPKAIINYSPDLKDANIGTIYARFNDIDNGVDVTLGHFYEQFGSGLILRSWEDRALGVNNAILGVRAKLRLTNSLDLTALTGKQRVGMGFDLSDSYIMGTNLEFNAADALKLENTDLRFGGSYVGRLDQQKEIEYEGVNDLVGTVSGRMNFGTGGFNLGAEYVYKQKDILVEIGDYMDGIFKDGNAFLVNMGYNADKFAMNLNLRRVENFGFFSQKNVTGNVFNYGMINYVPSLVKQYDHSLQNIYVYQALSKMSFEPDREKAGEIGGQFDVVYEAEEGSFLGGSTGAAFAVNGSYWAGLKNDAIYDTDEYGWEYVKDLKTKPFGFGTRSYSDISIEYRKPFSEKFSAIFSYLNQYYNSDFLEGKGYAIKANAVAAEGTYFLSDMKSIRLELQHLWADHDRKNWVGGTVEYVPNSNWSFFISDIYNYGTEAESEKLHYYNLGGAFTKGATRIAASYGRQRGGMICVGGVCRYVPESNGFTLNITTNF